MPSVGIDLILALVAASIGIASWHVGRTSSARKLGETEAEIRTDVKHILQKLEQIGVQVDKNQTAMLGHESRLASLEQQIASAVHRIEKMEGVCHHQARGCPEITGPKSGGG
jgi:peptidoglycan hydrolase CwlO-like protein